MIPKKPSNVIWSDEQWQAIYEDGKNILVSAGAGSGKTTVLTARVLEKLKRGVSLKNLIILTFTNAAAGEMKERIRKAIIKEITENSNTNLIEELNYIDQANVQTFDSYALELVKKYHYALKVDRNISICDSALLLITKKKLLDEIINEYYEKDDNDFIGLVKYLCLKNDELLKENILNVDEKLDLLVDRDDYLENYQARFLNKEFLNLKKDEFLKEIFKLSDEIKKNIEKLETLDNSQDFLKGVENIKKANAEIFLCKTYEDFANLKIGRINMPKGIDPELEAVLLNEKEVIKATTDKIKKYCTISSIDEQIENILKINQYVIKFIEIINALQKRISKFKRDNNLYTFMDISKMAIKLLQENDNIRLAIKDNTNEIMVDEYQDTSDIQEVLISLISNNNVYMVGDIKQSIYRFRNANPSIFSGKYVEYKHGNTNDTVIDLSKNFRSREEVLNNINMLFTNVMDMDFGGANYNDGHALIYGNKTYSKHKAENNDFEFYYYDSNDTEGYNSTELEAIIIANDIKEKVQNGYKVLKDKELVPVKYNDFCILSSTKTHFETFKKIFEMCGIPLAIHKEEKFVSCDEVNVIINLIRLVDCYCKGIYNNEFKFSLMSILKSFIVEEDDNVINDLMMSATIQDEMEKFIPDVFNKLENIKNNYYNLTLGDLVEVIFEEFDIYGNLYKLVNIEGVENRLAFLISKANELSKIGYSPIDFVRFLDTVKSNELDIIVKEASGINLEVVNMMSIHKSKGLEFNICYFPLISTRFIFSELNEKIVFDKDLGIIFPVFNEGMQESYLKTIMRIRTLRDEISEKIRLLYVALTRAKDKFIVISKPINCVNSDNSFGSLNKSLYNSFYDIFKSINQFLTLYKKPIFVKTSSLSLNRNKIIDNDEEVEFVDLNIQNKYITEKRASIEKNTLITIEDYTKMNFGTIVHEYLELIDINNYQEEVMKTNLSDYYKKKLLKFYETLIGLQLNDCKIYHEYEFMSEEDDEVYHGIIDLLVEKADKFIIIDYKLSDITKSGYVQQLKVYCDYIKKLTNKQVECYLYSIINEELKKINV